MNKIDEWKQNHNLTSYDNILLLNKLYEKGFNDIQIGEILEVLDNICVHCWNSEPKCYCNFDSVDEG